MPEVIELNVGVELGDGRCCRAIERVGNALFVLILGEFRSKSACKWLMFVRKMEIFSPPLFYHSKLESSQMNKFSNIPIVVHNDHFIRSIFRILLFFQVPIRTTNLNELSPVFKG